VWIPAGQPSRSSQRIYNRGKLMSQADFPLDSLDLPPLSPPDSVPKTNAPTASQPTISPTPSPAASTSNRFTSQPPRSSVTGHFHPSSHTTPINPKSPPSFFGSFLDSVPFGQLLHSLLPLIIDLLLTNLPGTKIACLTQIANIMGFESQFSAHLANSEFSGLSASQ
jgi:hypothetical protein